MVNFSCRVPGLRSVFIAVFLLAGFIAPVSGLARSAGASPLSNFTPREVTLGGEFGTSSNYGYLLDDACVTTSSCVAVGNDGNGQPLVIVGNPADWTMADARAMTLPSGTFGAPSSGNPNGLWAVTCSSITWCVAVGNDANDQPLVVTGNPATWSSANAREVALPSLDFGAYNVLNSISCLSSIDCVAVGSDGNGQPFSVSGNPASWSSSNARELTLPSLVFGSYNYLTSVSCLSSSNCVAVGFDGNNLPLSVSGNPATWSSADATELSLGSARGQFNSVSCFSTSDCVAVGYDSNNQPIVLTGNPQDWLGGAIREITLGAGFGLDGNFLFGLSCSSSTYCTAVGYDGNFQPIVVSGDPATWTSADFSELTLGTSFGTTYPFPGLSGISCVTTGGCVAVGVDHNGQPLVAYNVSVPSSPTNVSASIQNAEIDASWTPVENAVSYTCTLLYGYNNPSTFTVTTVSPACSFSGLGSTDFGVSVVANSTSGSSAPTAAFPVSSVKIPPTTPKVHTITCQKGTTSHKKKVTSTHPVCPSGWHRI